MKGQTFKHLKYADRVKIEALFSNRKSASEIAAYIGCSRATVYRELKRGRYERLTTELKKVPAYSADIAQKDYDYKASAKGSDLKIANDYEFVAYVEQKIINEKYSPAAVIGEIKTTGKRFATTVCVKTLYNYIDRNLFLHLTNDDLLRKKNRKRAYKKVHSYRIIKPLHESIDARPEIINLRKEFGHWEMDTVIGQAKGKGQVLLVLTERKTRQEMIFKMRRKTEREVIRVLNRLERKYGARFRQLFKTITVDNGCEFLDCENMEKSCLRKGKRTKIYYCHPYSAFERGSNENANAIIRRFIPKGTRFETVSQKQLEYIEHWINNYPRKIHDYRCANALFLENLECA